MDTLAASPVRHRPDNPTLFWDFWAGIQAQGPTHTYLAVHEAGQDQDFLVELQLRDVPHDRFGIPASRDLRTKPGPRCTGETMENLAFLRNKLLRRFQQLESCKYLLMVDSDIVLAPGALDHLVATAEREGLDSLTALIDTNHHASDSPMANAMLRGNSVRGFLGPRAGDWVRWSPEVAALLPSSYRRGPNLHYVHRAGACTLFSRRVLELRFHWDPRFGDEQDWLFIEMGQRYGHTCHWLDTTPGLADHRRTFAPTLQAELEKWLADPRSGNLSTEARQALVDAEAVARELGKELTPDEVRRIIR